MRFHSHYRSVGTGHIYQGRFLGFCSLQSHCDSVFQQFDQLSGTVSAVVPSLKHAAIFPMWVRVFPCGCEFSTCTSPTRWKSCRHKRHRHLTLNWFRTGGNDLIGRRRGIQRQGETPTPSTLELTVLNAESEPRPTREGQVSTLAARGKSHPCTFSTCKTSVLSECCALATASCGRKGCLSTACWACPCGHSLPICRETRSSKCWPVVTDLWLRILLV